MLTERSRFPIRQMILYGFLPSRLKTLVYRLKGAKVGRGVTIGLGSVIVADSLEIGDCTKIGFLTIVRARHVKIGRFVKIGSMTIIDTETVEIDDDAKINEQVFVGGPRLPESSLKIGKRAIVMQLSFLNPTKPIIIGDDTGIGGHCLLFTHGSWQSQLDGYPVKFAPITLENNVWLPWRVFIMPGVTVGEGSTIGADSLVVSDIPRYSLAAGSPARVLRKSPDYPEKPSEKERHELITGILAELFRYLEYHSYQVSRSDTENEVLAAIKKGRARKHLSLLYVRDGQTASALSRLNERSVYLSLATIPSEVAVALEARGVMSLDLAGSLRTGMTAIGEETVAFLSRYGVRFERT